MCRAPLRPRVECLMFSCAVEARTLVALEDDNVLSERSDNDDSDATTMATMTTPAKMKMSSRRVCSLPLSPLTNPGPCVRPQHLSHTMFGWAVCTQTSPPASQRASQLIGWAPGWASQPPKGPSSLSPSPSPFSHGPVQHAGPAPKRTASSGHEDDAGRRPP